jgi:predicted nucleotidyltransferase
MSFTDHQKKIVDDLLTALIAIPNVKAVVLGGSFASGKNTPTSDIDLALYYDETAPFEISNVQDIVNQFSDSPGAVATPFYGWGAWVNGGAWLTIEGQRVDILYRNIEQVEKTIAECQRGDFQTDYYQQPAHGFFSYIYLAETEICVPLYDPDYILHRFKKDLRPYPSALKSEIYRRFKVIAQFTFDHLEKAVKRGDVFMAAGSVTRISSAMVQILFALNEAYFMNDKRALEEIEAFAVRPPGFSHRLTDILQYQMQTVDELAQLLNETLNLQ